jgi:hypothetical protein
MTEREATTMVLMLRTAFSNERWDGATTKFWETRMQRLDNPKIAYDVIEKMIDREERRPAWSLIRDAYGAEARRRADDAARERGLEGVPRDFGIPSWVYVWTWARFYRDPVVDHDIRLPQEQWDHEAETRLREITVMSDAEYETLHDEWVAAGAPRHDPRERVGM